MLVCSFFLFSFFPKQDAAGWLIMHGYSAMVVSPVGTSFGFMVFTGLGCCVYLDSVELLRVRGKKYRIEFHINTQKCL